MTEFSPREPEHDARAQRLFDVYAQALRGYLKAEAALAEASVPVAAELVYEFDMAAEHFQTIRGLFRAAARRSEAFHAVEGRHS